MQVIDIFYPNFSFKIFVEEIFFYLLSTESSNIIYAKHSFVFFLNLTLTKIGFELRSNDLFIFQNSTFYLTNGDISLINEQNSYLIEARSNCSIFIDKIRFFSVFIKLFFVYSNNLIYLKNVDLSKSETIFKGLTELSQTSIITINNIIFENMIFLTYQSYEFFSINLIFNNIMFLAIESMNQQTFPFIFNYKMKVIIKNCTFKNFGRIFLTLKSNNILITNSKILNWASNSSLNSIIEAETKNTIKIKNCLIKGVQHAPYSTRLLFFNFNNYFLVEDSKLNVFSAFNLIFSHHTIFIEVNLYNKIKLKKVKVEIHDFFCFLKSNQNNLILFFSMFFEQGRTLSTYFLLLSFSSFLGVELVFFNFLSNFVKSFNGFIQISNLKMENIKNSFCLITQSTIKISRFTMENEMISNNHFFQIQKSKIYAFDLVFSNIRIKMFSSFFLCTSSIVYILKCIYFQIKVLDKTCFLIEILGDESKLLFKKNIIAFSQGTSFTNFFQLDLKNNFTIFISLNFFRDKEINDLYEPSYFNLIQQKSNIYSKTSSPFLSNRRKIFLKDFLKKVEKDSYLFFLVPSVINFRAKTLKLEKIIPGKNYSECLLSVLISDSSDRLFLDSSVKWEDIFEIKENNGNDGKLSFLFKNEDEGNFCLTRVMKEDGSFPNILIFEIHLKDFPEIIPLILKLDLEYKCPIDQYSDSDGNCFYCPNTYFPNSMLIYQQSMVNCIKKEEKCLPCNKKLGFNCIGINTFNAKLGFWESSLGSNNFYKCPFEKNCRGNELYQSDQGFFFNQKDRYLACNLHSKGVFCLKCQINFGRWVENECSPCFSYHNSFFFIFHFFFKLLMCFFLSKIVFLIHSKYKIPITENLSRNYIIKLYFWINFYQKNSIFIQILNTVISTNYHNFTILRRLIQYLLVFSTTLEFNLPFECFPTYLPKFFFNLTMKLFFVAFFIMLIFYWSIRNLQNSACFKSMLLKSLRISIGSVFYFFFYTLFEFAHKIFFCFEIKLKDSEPEARLSFYDIDIDCNSQNYMAVSFIGGGLIIILIGLLSCITFTNIFFKKIFIFYCYKEKFKSFAVIQIVLCFLYAFLLNFVKFSIIQKNIDWIAYCIICSIFFLNSIIILSCSPYKKSSISFDSFTFQEAFMYLYLPIICITLNSEFLTLFSYSVYIECFFILFLISIISFNRLILKNLIKNLKIFRNLEIKKKMNFTWTNNGTSKNVERRNFINFYRTYQKKDFKKMQYQKILLGSIKNVDISRNISQDFNVMYRRHHLIKKKAKHHYFIIENNEKIKYLLVSQNAMVLLKTLKTRKSLYQKIVFRYFEGKIKKKNEKIQFKHIFTYIF